MKVPKFLYCTNPMATKGGKNEFILHVREPYLMVKILYYETQEAVKHDIDSFAGKYPHHSFAVDFDEGEDPEFYVFLLTHEFTQRDHDKFHKLMKRMEDWWVAYLNHELDELEFAEKPVHIDERDYFLAKAAMQLVKDESEFNPSALHAWETVITAYENNLEVDEEALEESVGFAAVYLNT